MKVILLILSLGFASFPILSHAQVVARKATGGFFDFNYYKDSRDFTVLTINLLATSDSLQYFGFTNFEGQAGAADSKDSALYYSEQNLRLKLTEKGILSWSFQAALQSGEQNDAFRGGILFDAGKTSLFEDFFQRHKIRFGLNFFPMQLDEQSGYNWQLEYFYNIQLAPMMTQDRLYLSGFADQNLGDQKPLWVTEHQLGFRVIENFFLVTEYRINQFLRKKTGMAYGLEYALPF